MGESRKSWSSANEQVKQSAQVPDYTASPIGDPSCADLLLRGQMPMTYFHVALNLVTFHSSSCLLVSMSQKKKKKGHVHKNDVTLCFLTTQKA